MLQALRNILYYLFVETSFYYYFIFPIIGKFVRFPPLNVFNHQIIDEGGSKLKATKFKGKLFPPVSIAKLSSIKHLRVRESDILIAGYPKTGCHWSYEILYMMKNKTLSLSKYGKVLGGMIDTISDIVLDSLPSPRILNSHLTYDDLPHEIKTRRTKIILTVRCVKDTVVSYYHHQKNLFDFYGYDGKFENYFKLFMAGNVEFGDFFDYYHGWNAVIASGAVNEIFLLKFEDLKHDPVTMIKRLAKFLEMDISHQAAVDIAEASSFESMKKSRSSNPRRSKIFRKGVVGDWKNWLDDGQKEEMDRKWEEVEKECNAVLERQNGILS